MSRNQRKLTYSPNIVNNAGVPTYHQDSTEATVEEWDNVFNTNVRGTYFLITAAIPYLSKGASIINIGSIVGTMGSSRMNIYAASKAAINGLTLNFAEEIRYL